MVEIMLMCTHTHTHTHTLTQQQTLVQMEIGRTGMLTRGTGISSAHRKKPVACVEDPNQLILFGSQIGW